MNHIFEAIAHPDRRAILRMLKKADELNAGDIADAFSVSRPTISHHLNTLLKAGLIDRERRGQQLFYRLNLSVFLETVQLLFDLFDVSSTEPTDES